MPNNTYILTSDGELYHYGVVGMKWGVRRYRNPDGSLTAEGRRQAKAEYKEDNKKAFELGKDATITGRAMGYALARSARIQNKLDKQFEKDPEGTQAKTQKLTRKWMASTETAKELAQMYAMQKDMAKQHCESLIGKYGQEAVSSIKYKDVKMPKSDGVPSKISIMNERTNSLTTYAKAGARTIATSAAFSLLLGSPISVLSIPRSAANKGFMVERDMYRSKMKQYKNAKFIIPNN